MERYKTKFTERPPPVRSNTTRQGTTHERSKTEEKSTPYDDSQTKEVVNASTSSLHTVIVSRSHQKDASKRFSVAIADLERLLDEAVQIARNAAEDDEARAQESSTEEIEEMPLTSKKNVSYPRLPRASTARQQNRVAFVESETQDPVTHLFKRTRDATPYPPASAAASRRASAYPSRHQSRYEPRKKSSSDSPPLPLRHDWATKSDTKDAPNLPVPNAQFKRPPTRCGTAKARELAVVPERPNQRMENLALPAEPSSAARPLREEQYHLSRQKTDHSGLPTRTAVKSYIKVYNEPPIEPRRSSVKSQSSAVEQYELKRLSPRPVASENDMASFRQPSDESGCSSRLSPGVNSLYDDESHHRHKFALDETDFEAPLQGTTEGSGMRRVDVKGHRHVDIASREGFSLSRSCHHQPVARDWCASRKRLTATTACVNTALIGILIGIYAGEVPAIQYALADQHHYTILGNVFLYLGLAISTLFFWPLPLLHGRRPYTISALALALPLQIPQGLAVGAFRSPDVSSYRVMLLVARAVSGFVLGFANINSQATLLDLFGASLMGANPHQEIVNEYDIRRHGGGMGLWLGIWSFCFIGSIGLGFFVGALLVGNVNVTWGFWIAIFLIICVLLLNVVTPEVRRSAYRRTIAEIKHQHGTARRIARGEIKMHLTSKGPLWWGEEVKAGVEMCKRMMKQFSFAVLALYMAWVYAQIILVMMLLGALASKYYRLHPELVGLSVFGLSVGALLGVPFQMGSFFSRARHHPQRTDSMTFEKQVTWSSHLVRRSLFMITLPLSGLAYTLSSGGPPLHPALPACFAGLVGWLSSLAIAEGFGLIIETYDTSDLQPGMIGRPRSKVAEKDRKQRTCFSCYPRISAGLAIVQGLSFLLAAAATGTGGGLERRLGAKEATGVVAAILMGLTLLLTSVLWRFKTVKMIPNPRFELGKQETTFEPTIIGNPSGTTRRMNLLEMGRQTRWTEIRRRNRLTFLGME